MPREYACGRLGSRASVAFRPEKIRLRGTTAPDLNRLTCVVSDVVYTGSSTTYLVTFQDANPIMVRLLNEEASAGHAASPGEQVTISWPIEVSKAFPEESGESRA